MDNNVLKIHQKDTVLVALKNMAGGSAVNYNGETYTLKDNVPAKHKFFMRDEKAGDDIIMYGVLVGKTRMDVLAGNRLTTENVKHAATPYHYRHREFHWTPPDVSRFRDRQFMGYHRSDGRVGTANYWLFIPTVFCENRNMDVIREVLQDELGYSVTEKYKAYTRQLIRSHQEGKNLKDAMKEAAAVPVRIRPFWEICWRLMPTTRM